MLSEVEGRATIQAEMGRLKQILLLSGIFSGLCCTGFAEDGELVLQSPFTEEQRLRGYHIYQNEQKDFEKERLSGIGDVKKEQKKWNEMMSRTLPAHKADTAREAAPLDEKSAAYKKDLFKRFDDFEASEASRKRYIAFRNAAAAKKKANIKLTEEEEYALNLKTERVDPKLRALYVAKAKPGSSSGGGGSYGGGGGGNFEPPPPPPPMPPADYYEPEIPPPPPPLDGFDDSIPPPIFDDPPPEF